MTNHVSLPGGGWANIKTPDLLTNRERKVLRRVMIGAAKVGSVLRDTMRAVDLDAIRADPFNIPDEIGEKVAGALSPDEMDQMTDVQAALIVAYVAEWSIGERAVETFGQAAEAWLPRHGSRGDVLVSPNPTMETVDDLPSPVYDAFTRETMTLGDGTVDFGVDGAGDRSSPTVPSAV
jgi:hypothetical protein